MSKCVACGHSVVAWCPDDSDSDDDLVCYDCGLHADSQVAKIIKRLRRALDDIKVQGWERGQMWAHDMALKALQGDDDV